MIEEAIVVVSDISRGVFKINRSLYTMKRMLNRTRILVFNAKISSDNNKVRVDSFGSMVLEFSQILRELTSAFDNVEALSWETAIVTARSLSSLSRMQKIQEAAAMGNTWSASDGAALDPSHPVALLAAHAPSDRGRRHELFARKIEASKEAMADTVSANLVKMQDLIHRLRRTVRIMNWLAVKRIHVLSISSLVETSRRDLAASNLPVIAGQIRTLAKEIAVVVDRTNDEIVVLRSRLERTTEWFATA